ncbi:MAG TPA: tripartite tricarboxylate transporter TctB family protein [Burkholderiales bacterium]|nr:tripartite tricarboxylate transporter TctB family protein [Burkholderiales bacterium]
MKPDLRNNRDFIAGLLFIVLGGLAVVLARDYPFGTTMRMGPGYFPTVLGGILLLFGVYVLARGVRSGDRVKGEWGWKPLALIVLSIVLFGLLLDRVGMIPATVVTLIVAAAAGREFRWKEVILLAAVMTAFSVAVFSYGLKLPYPLLGGYY